jgi:hypothetical protein
MYVTGGRRFGKFSMTGWSRLALADLRLTFRMVLLVAANLWRATELYRLGEILGVSNVGASTLVRAA